MLTRATQPEKTKGFCVADFATLSDERRSRSKIILLLRMIFICFSSGKFKFGQKSDANSYVPAQKFTYNLLNLQSAKKSLILPDCGSLHLRKMKLFVNNLA